MRVYKLIIKADSKNMNLIKTILSVNEEKYRYQKLKTNEEIFIIHKDDDMVMENTYLIQTQSLFLKDKCSLYSMAPISLIYLFLIFISKNKIKNSYFIATLILITFNLYIKNMKMSLNNGRLHTSVERNNFEMLKKYKNFYNT